MKEQAFIDAIRNDGFTLLNYTTDPVVSMAFSRWGSLLHILEFSSGKAVAIYDSQVYFTANDLSTLLFVVAANFFEEHMQELEDDYLDMYDESLSEEY